MTDFTNVAALVAQGQSLLDEIKGGKLAQIDASFLQKLVDVDAALAANIAQANTDIANAVAPIDGKIPHTLLTENNKLVVSSGTVPDSVVAPASSTFSVFNYIESYPDGRDASQQALLAEMELEIKEQFPDFSIRSSSFYFSGFNVIKIDWDFGNDFVDYDDVMQLGVSPSVGQGNRMLISNEMTSQGLVKLISGSLVDHDVVKGAVTGKWRYCNYQAAQDKKSFGRFENTYVRATSQTGSLLIALPSIVTGLVSHPKHIHF